jgi:hypothetical protein
MEGARKPVQMSLFGADSATKETRAIAAAAALPKGPGRREKVIEFVTKCGTHGATPDEMSARLGYPAQSMPALVGALKKTGRLIPTPRRRMTRCNSPAVVYVVPGATLPTDNGSGA